MGRDSSCPLPGPRTRYFNPLSPHGERLWIGPTMCTGCYFNPLSPHGERRGHEARCSRPDQFQSTLPAWGETYRAGERVLTALISIHSPRMGRDRRRGDPEGREAISIHSPRMGRDAGPPASGGKARDFNPLSPHGERREVQSPSPQNLDFNPLSPHGERHLRRVGGHGRLVYFNPLSPHGERRRSGLFRSVPWYFNPLSPHGERHNKSNDF